MNILYKYNEHKFYFSEIIVGVLSNLHVEDFCDIIIIIISLLSSLLLYYYVI